MLRKTAFFLSLLVSTAGSMPAANYYVSPYGNDLLPGNNPLLPWATITKVNAANLQDGDHIYFLRGGTWRGSLLPQRSDLYYGAYGTGDRPVISGASQLTTGWTNVQPNVWAYPLGGVFPSQVWFNGVLGTKVGGGNPVTASLEWDYYWNTLFVYSTNNPASQYTSGGVEAAQSFAAMEIKYIHNLTVEHLALVKGNSYSAVQVFGVSGVETFNDVVFSDSGAAGLWSLSGNPVINNSEILNNGIGMNVYGGDGFTLTDSIVSGNFNQAVMVSGTDAPSFVYNSTLTGNGTHNPIAYTVTNTSAYPLNVQSSILLPNPFQPKPFNFSGMTDAGGNVYQSPSFTTRAAPLIVVPFVDDYINLGVAQSVSKLAANAGCKMSYALNTKLLTPAAWQSVAQMQAAGVEIVAHTRSHSDLANNNVFSIQYTGTAATATMVINQTTNRLQTFLNGSTMPDLNLDLSDTYNGVVDVLGRIPGGSSYKVAIQPNQLYFTPINLANVPSVNIKSAPYMTQASANYLTWEIEGAQSDIAANLSGYKAKAFATPFTSSNLGVETHIQGAGFVSNRNGLLNGDQSADGNWLFSTLDVYNMGAEWLPFAFDGTKPVSSTAALVEGLGASGGVMALYSHGYDEFSLQNWADLFANLKQLGATCMTISQANAYVESHGQLVPDGTKKTWAETVPLTPNYTLTSSSPSAGAHNVINQSPQGAPGKWF